MVYSMHTYGIIRCMHIYGTIGYIMSIKREMSQVDFISVQMNPRFSEFITDSA